MNVGKRMGMGKLHHSSGRMTLALISTNRKDLFFEVVQPFEPYEENSAVTTSFPIL